MVKMPEEDHHKVLLHNNCIYCHKTLWMDYTTYDCHWDQDTINPWTHSDVIVLASEDKDIENTHPYWYAHGIGIFHAMVHQVGGTAICELMDFLWGRWYGLHTHACSGFNTCQLHQIGLLDSHEDRWVLGLLTLLMLSELSISSLHFNSGHPLYFYLCSSTSVSASTSRRRWQRLCSLLHWHVGCISWPLHTYSNQQWRFVDCNIFACFCGFGPGHRSTHTVAKLFQDDIKNVFRLTDSSEVPEDVAKDRVGSSYVHGLPTDCHRYF
jgi:hypothetical protein